MKKTVLKSVSAFVTASLVAGTVFATANAVTAADDYTLASQISRLSQSSSVATLISGVDGVANMGDYDISGNLKGLDYTAVYDKDTNTYNLTFVIDSDEDSEVVIRLDSILDILDIYATYGLNQNLYLMPGDREFFNVNIVNNSDSEYEYSVGSFILATPGFTAEEVNSELENVFAFDGQSLPESYINKGSYIYKTTAVPVAELLTAAGAEVTSGGMLTGANYVKLDTYLSENYDGATFADRMLDYVLKYYNAAGTYSSFNELITNNDTAREDFYSPSGTPKDLGITVDTTAVVTHVRSLTGLTGLTDAQTMAALVGRYVKTIAPESTSDYASKTSYNSLSTLLGKDTALTAEQISDIKAKFFFNSSNIKKSIIKLYDCLYGSTTDTAYNSYLKSINLYSELPDKYKDIDTSDAAKGSSLFNTINISIAEPVYTSATYDKFYQTSLSLYYGAGVPENLVVSDGWSSKKLGLTVGNYMAGYGVLNTEESTNAWADTDYFFATLFGDGIDSNESVSFNTGFNIDGPLTGNAYQSSEWSWYSSITLHRIDPEPVTTEEPTTAEPTTPAPEVEADEETTPAPEVEADEEPTTENETEAPSRTPEVEADIETGDFGLVAILGLAAIVSGATTVIVFKKK